MNRYGIRGKSGIDDIDAGTGQERAVLQGFDDGESSGSGPTPVVAAPKPQGDEDTDSTARRKEDAT